MTGSELRPLAAHSNYVAPPGRGGPRCRQLCARRSSCCACSRPEVGPASLPPAAQPFPARGLDLVVAPASRLSQILALLPGAPHLLCSPIGLRTARPGRGRPRPPLFYPEAPGAFPIVCLVASVSFLPLFASPLPFTLLSPSQSSSGSQVCLGPVWL